MKTIRNVTHIAAPPEAVWQIVTDLDGYREWNPFITSVSGDLRVGGRLRATFTLADAKPRTFTPTVTVHETGHRLTWVGHLAVRGLFDAEHTIAVEPQADGTELVHSEQFRGVLVPLLRRTLHKTHDAFLAMDRALAERAAAGASRPDS